MMTIIEIDVTEILVESSDDHKVIAVIAIAKALGLKAIDAGNQEGLLISQLPIVAAVMKLLRMLEKQGLINQDNTSMRLIEIIRTKDSNSLFHEMMDPKCALGVRHRYNEIWQKRITIDTTGRKED